MKLSKMFLITFGLYVLTIPAYFMYRSSTKSHASPINIGSNQQSVPSSKVFFSSRNLMEDVEGSGEGHATGVDCSKCEHQKIPYTEPQFYINLLIIFGIFSGLTVGYMGIDPLLMEYQELHGTPTQAAAAKRIRPLLKKHHLLLATLLTGNSLCFEALPIFMDAIMPSWLAILLSATFILVMGEVVPQALCTGPKQIEIAAGVAPLVNFFMVVFLPVTYFIAKMLDYFVVHTHKRYNRRELFGIVGLHVKQGIIPLLKKAMPMGDTEMSQSNSKKDTEQRTDSRWRR